MLEVTTVVRNEQKETLENVKAKMLVVKINILKMGKKLLSSNKRCCY